jgi:hypothetical protein
LSTTGALIGDGVVDDTIACVLPLCTSVFLVDCGTPVVELLPFSPKGVLKGALVTELITSTVDDLCIAVDILCVVDPVELFGSKGGKLP